MKRYCLLLVLPVLLMACAGSPPPQRITSYFDLGMRPFEEQNYTQAVYWFRQGAEHGEAESQNI
jgi:TPR repeat protein